MPKSTPEQKAAFNHLALESGRRVVSLGQAVEQAMAGRKNAGEAIAAAWGPAVDAAMAELEEYSLPEILHALRTTYGAKPDPTRRLELLHNAKGEIPKYVSIQKAAQYARVSERRLQQLIAEGRLRCVGGKGHRRILTDDLIARYPAEE